MLAYSQVDQAVRRKLEEMLKTWREPVPGSLSSTPVFPLQATQSIMDALNRFKASTAGRAAQAPLRAPSIVQAQAVNYRQTPTPPQPGQLYPQPQINVQNPTPTPPPQPYYQVRKDHLLVERYLTCLSSHLNSILKHKHQSNNSILCNHHIKLPMAMLTLESILANFMLILTT